MAQKRHTHNRTHRHNGIRACRRTQRRNSAVANTQCTFAFQVKIIATRGGSDCPHPSPPPANGAPRHCNTRARAPVCTQTHLLSRPLFFLTLRITLYCYGTPLVLMERINGVPDPSALGPRPGKASRLIAITIPRLPQTSRSHAFGQCALRAAALVLALPLVLFGKQRGQPHVVVATALHHHKGGLRDLQRGNTGHASSPEKAGGGGRRR